MPETRPPIKLDFTTGLESLPKRPRMDLATTEASVSAGHELGFTGRATDSRMDGRRLRSRGANIQLNLKITAEDKARILMEASRLIQDPASPVSTIGEFIVLAVDLYRRQVSRHVEEETSSQLR